MWEYNRQNELYHHGIPGQKWGVRRYQNYDGSLTQAGMKRYNKSLEAYGKADARYKNAKKNGADDAELTNAKLARKNAKRQLDKDYKHLKQDKLADQGKKLYANGKTITGNSTITSTLATIGSMSLSAAGYNHQNKIINDPRVDKALIGIGGLSLAAAGAKYATDAYQAKRLRAYYAHTSKY